MAVVTHPSAVIEANTTVLSFSMCIGFCSFSFFFFNDTATTEIYTLSLHDALPIPRRLTHSRRCIARARSPTRSASAPRDRKSTRLNSSHVKISYAVFCLKKKKKRKSITRQKRSIIDHVIILSNDDTDEE